MTQHSMTQHGTAHESVRHNMRLYPLLQLLHTEHNTARLWIWTLTTLNTLFDTCCCCIQPLQVTHLQVQGGWQSGHQGQPCATTRQAGGPNQTYSSSRQQRQDGCLTTEALPALKPTHCMSGSVGCCVFLPTALVLLLVTYPPLPLVHASPHKTQTAATH
jgi:hypothetical protein